VQCYEISQFRNERLQGRAAADVHAAQAPRDQADRAHGPQNLDPPFAIWSLATLGHPRPKPRRIRATYNRPRGVRNLIAACDVGSDRLYEHIK
jgi:hypothetical protein